MRTRALALAALLFAASAPALAADPVPAPLFGSEAEAAGDFDAYYRELVAAVAANPESPYAALMLDRIRSLGDFAIDAGVLEAQLLPALDRGVRNADVREGLQDLLADAARARGAFGEARTLGGNDGYVTDWAAIGPFGWSGDVLVHRRFAPETAPIDPAGTLEGTRGPVSWTRLPKEGDTAWVSPYEQIRQGGVGVVYAMARLRADVGRTVAFKVWCNESFAITVNGDEVVVADRQYEHVGRPVWATARLEAGWNRVLVKITGRTSLALKLADPITGAPLTDVVAGDPLSTEPAPHATTAAEPLSHRTPAQLAADLAADDDPLRLAAAAQLLADAGQPWQAYEAFEKAAAGATGLPAVTRANLLAAHGRFLADFSEFPTVQRKLRAKAAYAAALEARPDHHSATLRTARYIDEDDHPDEAVNMLQEYVAKHPTPMVWMTIAEISKNRGWEKEAVAAAEAALEEAPRHTAAIRFLAQFDRRYGAQETYLGRIRRLVEIDASDRDALGALIDALRARGDDDQALAELHTLAERWPDSWGYRRQIASVLRDLGRLDESLAEWRALSARIPSEESFLTEQGEILELLGRKDEAIAAYEQSLDLTGFQPNVWRALARLRGESEDFAAPFEPNVDQILSELPSDEELRKAHPKAVDITILDHSVVRVRRDGSSSSIVHMVYKILDEKGVAKHDAEPNSGELLNIRVIQPDGTVMKPTGLRGRPYNLEGLVPGSIVEHRYLVHQQPGRKGYDGGQFFFQDFNFRNQPSPVFTSRYVVLSEPGQDLPHVKRNYEGEPEVRTTPDGLTATIWEKHDMPRIEWEQGMPEKEEIVPYVDYSIPPTMEDANWEMLAGRDDSRGSPLLAEALVGVVSPEMSDMEKLQALHAFVNSEITGDYGVGSGPTSILMEKAGDRAQLFEALVREAGIPYRLGRAMAWRGGSRDLTRPTSSLFNGPFLWLEPRDADPVAYFGGARHAPFGLVPEAYRGSFAFLCSRQGGEIIRLAPGGADPDTAVDFDVQLGTTPEDTHVRGDIQYRADGGYRFKRRLLDMSQDDRKKFAEGQFRGYFASPALQSYALPGVETPGEPLTVHIEGTMSQYLSRQGDKYVATLGLPESDMTGKYVQRPEREFDLILNVRADGVVTYRIHVAAGFEVTKLPADHLAVHSLGVYSLTFRQDGDVVHVRRELHLQPARYTPEQYGEFIAWCKSIDDAEQVKIEFRAR